MVSQISGLITPIVSGINIYLPLIGAASTAGLGTVLAALGALKLGAAAVFFATQSKTSDDEAGGYGAPVEEVAYGAPEPQVDTYGAPQEVDTYGSPAPQVDTYGAPQVDTYGAPSRLRQRRSTQLAEADNILSLVETLDSSHCAKQLVCQIHAKQEEARTQEELMIVGMFSKVPGVAASKLPMVEFETAAKIGATTRSGDVCQEAYSSCPYSATQILALFRSL